MTLDELKAALKKAGYSNFNVETTPVGPDDEWTSEEQIDDCCEEIPNHDDCVEDGKVERWDGWTEEEKEQLGYTPDGPTPEELLAQAELTYGKGNVSLKIKKVGPTPCGEKRTRWVDTLSCCFSPSELLKYQGVTTASPDDDKTFSVQTYSGEFPVTWHVKGQGASVAKKDNTTAKAHFDNCFCNPVVIYAQDSCESVAPWIVSRTGGVWNTIDDTNLESPFGWFQDGVLGNFYVVGFSDDNTKVSTQHYFEEQGLAGTEEQICAGSYPAANSNPIVEPQESQGFTKCESSSIWFRLREGFTNVYDVRYAINNQGTSEFTHSCQTDALQYGEQNPAPVIADYSHASFFWTGGVAPFSVVVDGVEFYLDAARTTNQVYNYYGQSIKVYAGNACGGGYITITDACGSSVEGFFRSASGYWQYWQEAADNVGGLKTANGPFPAIVVGHTSLLAVWEWGMVAGGFYEVDIGYWKGRQPLNFANSSWNDTYQEAVDHRDQLCAAGSNGYYSPVVSAASFTNNVWQLGATGNYTSCGNGVYIHDDGIYQSASHWAFKYAVSHDYISYASSHVSVIVDKWIC